MVAALSAAEPSPPAAAEAPPVSSNAAPLDDMAELVPDSAATLAEAFSRRAEMLLLAQQSHQQDLQMRMDRMKADFNAAQEQRSEALREMNALRDMAVEQSKKDDEILKKYISMI